MKQRTKRRRAPAAVIVSTALLCGLVQGQAWADPAPAGTGPSAGAKRPNPSQIVPTDRDEVLGKEWKESADRAWTTSGDATGFHLLVADKKAGYAWRTAATLAEAGFDTDMWIGNACVTGSGKRAVVAYAPRTFTNRAELMARGAFTAVVDLESGQVTKLNRQASLAYFSPGCGKDETAVLTQSGGETHNATRLLKVDASAAQVGKTIELPGQVTSAIPVGKDIVAADAARITKIDDEGRATAIARTNQVPFGLTPDAAGGVVFMDRSADSAEKGEVKRVTAQDISHPDAAKAKPPVLAKGTLAKMDLAASADGKVFITGETKTAGRLPSTVTRRADVPKDSTSSTHGEALITRVSVADGADPRTSQAPIPESADIDVKVLKTGKAATFTVTPPQAAASAASVSVASQAAAPAASGTAEPERYCSVPRNNPAKQAMQPKPRQVEWAVDQAITGNLDKHISRPANWKSLGMAAYQPQALFPRLALEGGGRVPAQVMLGITAQESNMWQASRVVVPGVTGNPLIGNFYGIKYAANGQQTDPWGINWSEADCGYGITQITDGMRMHGKEKPGEQPLSTLQQEAAALDYTANVAAGLRVLADKWNVTKRDGMIVNNGDPQYMENWFFALWAYNSGYYPRAAAASNGGLWGVGFTNNPANPLWKANRAPFLEGPAGGNDYSHAKHPQDWPYQEKVLGWAARPLEAMESPGKMVAGFRPAWWTGDHLKSTVKPSEGLFCTAANNCDPTKIGPNDQNKPGLGACQREDLKCWWNQPVTWKNCANAECGYELVRFNDTYPEEADGTAYPPNCTTAGLPANALIIDDVADGTPIARPGCSQPKATSGTFSLDFGSPSARIDFQQLGAGYGGHFWFAHTRKDDATGQRMKATGTWTLNQSLNGAAKVMVHLPDHGAHTLNAKYEVTTAKGVRTRTIGQKGNANRWVSIGAFQFNNVPTVKLSSITPDGTGDQDIAFDAIAVVPINAKYVERSLTAASIFDKNQSLNSNMPGAAKTPLRTMKTLYDWALSRSYRGPSWEDNNITEYGVTHYPRCAQPGQFPTTDTCTGQKTYDAAEIWRQRILAGGHTVRADGGVPAESIPQWMAMSNNRPDPAKTAAEAYKDDNSYKIKSDIIASYLADDTGKIIPDTEYVDGDVLIGNAHLPQFVVEIMKGIQADYGIPLPDISYTGIDALHWGDDRRVDPLGQGDVPGQAYKPHLRGGRISADGKCVDTRLVGGGAHGYRPMVANKHVDQNVKAWLDKVNANSNTHVGVKRWAGDVYSMFFKNEGLYPGDDHNTFGSSIGNAPPIWQDIAVAFCTDGSVKPMHLGGGNGDANPPNGIVYQSYMPDLYVYVDGKMTDNLGRPSSSRVQAGNWVNFSNIPVVNSDKGNAYGKCDVTTRGNGGNPWNVGVPFPVAGDTTDYRPNRMVHCDQPTAFFTETYTP
ncbi:hypothetical protein [Streptomyces sp. NPDC091027]|uniref:golvesin C-terminal-like domain-containing protein n=1 Tax=Streptomyces sp. NPDC091027 TaxID=3365971 RepID=UPI00381D8F4E